MKICLCLLSLTFLAACNGGGGSTNGGSGVTTPSLPLGYFKSGSITADQFITALNSIDGNDSYVQLYEDEVIRSYVAGEDQWFVIYDDKFDEYKAISLRYIRALTYYDYYSNDVSLADEFRYQEQRDLALGFGNYLNGDYWGDDYEVVDYDSYTEIYTGRNSGFEYEDEQETHDVSLLIVEKDQIEFFEKAARLSVAYNVGIETSLSLVTLADKANKMMNRGGGELTIQDQIAFGTDLQKLSGVSLIELIGASESREAKNALISKIAKKIGTSSTNLETRILPELFAVEI